jgi:ssDNA-binding Zn-finger/Zn-ribbon topoisomerase 1
MRIRWYCGHYYGPAYWKEYDDWVFEPDECGEEFETECDEEEWDDGSALAQCPKCGAKLTQQDDQPEKMGGCSS